MGEGLKTFLGFGETESTGHHRLGQYFLVLHPANGPEKLARKHGHITSHRQTTSQKGEWAHGCFRIETEQDDPSSGCCQVNGKGNG